MKSKSEILDVLKSYPQYQDILFARGYLLTEDTTIDSSDYPFFGKWTVLTVGGGRYRLFVHPRQTYYYHKKGGLAFLLIGHAYDPFSMQIDEMMMLKECGEVFDKGNLFDYISQWTGIFALFVLNDDDLTVVQDCAGAKAVYYGLLNGYVSITSHPQMLGDLYNLPMDDFVRRLVKNRFYNIGNRYLPGDLSQFKELKRLGANVSLSFGAERQFSIRRFFPEKPHAEIKTEQEYKEAIESARNILHHNFALIAQKWKRPVISLSGGTDSNTTLACANGLYEKYGYFSFQSKDTEVKDAEAAHAMCEQLKIPHAIYKIQSRNEDVEDFAILKLLIDHNTGYTKNLSDNEIRKYIYFYRKNDFDVEAKSWISEIARVMYERKYGMQMPKQLQSRHFSIFQTRYFCSPWLLKKSDEIYAEFMRKFDLETPKFNYEHIDLYFWEVRDSNWGMTGTQSMEVMNHVLTYPFNNRRLIELLLSIPKEKRITDDMHNDIIRCANPEISRIGIHTKNKSKSRKRIFMEKMYFYYRTLFLKKK